jgi:trigger factor
VNCRLRDQKGIILSSPETKEDITPASPGTEVDTHDHGHDHGTHHHEPEMNEECRREVKVEVPADEVTQATEKVIRKFQKAARLPGFRAGKVPVTIIKSRFMEDVRSEVVEALVPEYFRKAVDKEGYLPVSQPRITDLHFHEGEPLKFSAVFEVLPEIQVKDYRGLKAEKKDISVSQSEVEEALKTLQERQASYDAVEDRELKDGDFANISFSGRAKGTKAIAEKKAELAATKETGDEENKVQDAIEAAVEAESAKPVEVDDVLVEIGGKNTVKEFTENLRGANLGDERSFEVTYPDDFNDQRLAGQVMAYHVKVQGVKKKILPELNDDFAKELGEFATLDDLKKRIRENMEAERKHEIQHAEKDKLIDELVAKNEFPVPQALVERQIDVRLDRGLRALAAQGMKAEDMRRMNIERLRAGQRDAAVREVKASLLLDKIAEVENLEVTEEDINKEVEAAAEQTRQPVEALRAKLTKEGSLDRIKDRLRNEKALDFLYEHSA